VFPQIDTPSLRKARGAFFTPPPIADFLSRWAIRSATDSVLEPSCGEAAFLIPSGQRLLELGMGRQEGHLHGQDVHSDSLLAAQESLDAHKLSAHLLCGDFLERPATPTFDAVVGNPPFIRYQNHTGGSRAAGLQAALRQGVRLNQLASSWAPFTVHAAGFLKPEGRLALVLPAELLSVSYAAQVREFLLRRFANVRLVLFEKLVFPGVLEDVVLLMAEGSGGASHFEVYQAKDADDLIKRAPIQWTGFSPRGSEKWTRALVPGASIGVYEQVFTSHAFEVMADWGETYLGAVTGNNDYFTLSKQQAVALGLRSHELERISPPGSRHLQGLQFTEHSWEKLADAGTKCYLFKPGNPPSVHGEHYIRVGERLNVHAAYKCKVRSPWWKVPTQARPDFLFAYMSHERPRLVRNAANVRILNSVYGVRLHAARHAVGSEVLGIAFLNSMTLLGAEVVGRAYGGGMLKHEPKEVDMIPVPSLHVLAKCMTILKDMAPSIANWLDTGNLNRAIEAVDDVLLRQQMGLTALQLDTLRGARLQLLQRRIGRSKGEANGPNR